MAYEKQTFVNNSTVLTAEHLEHIEDGIYQNSTNIEKLAKDNDVFYVTVTEVTTESGVATQTGDKTVEEIAEAYQNGRSIMCRYGIDDNAVILSFLGVNSEYAIFSGVSGQEIAFIMYTNDGILLEGSEYATADMIPTNLPNPHSLTFTGAATGTYDGSTNKTVNIPTVDKASVTTALGYTPADVTDVFENALQPTFTNIFDSVGIEYGKMLETDGSVSDTTAALCVTDFIPVSAGDVIRVNEDFALFCSTAQTTPKVISYDASFTKLQLIMNASMAEGGYYFEALEKNTDGHIISFRVNKPSTVAYVRICNHTDNVGNNPVLTINEEIAYEMGYGSKLNSNIRVEQSQILNAPQKNGWSILPYEHLNIAYSSINRKPINTVEHFTDAATNFGYNALKCDVRPTSDGELVCCHDAGFTFDGDGYITVYDSTNATVIHDVTAATVLGYSFKTGEHPCLVGDYLDVCRKYGKVAFITIRNEYMDVVIPKLLEELRIHNMTYSTIINCMTYESLVQWRELDKSVMINYTLNYGVAIDTAQIDKAIGLGYCSLCGFGLNSSVLTPTHTCDFDYARENGIRLLQAIAYKEGSPEACYDLGYDGCQIGIAWGTAGGVSEDTVQTMIDTAIGSAIGGAY